MEIIFGDHLRFCINVEMLFPRQSGLAAKFREQLHNWRRISIYEAKF